MGNQLLMSIFTCFGLGFLFLGNWIGTFASLIWWCRLPLLITRSPPRSLNLKYKLNQRWKGAVKQFNGEEAWAQKQRAAWWPLTVPSGSLKSSTGRWGNGLLHNRLSGCPATLPWGSVAWHPERLLRSLMRKLSQGKWHDLGICTLAPKQRALFILTIYRGNTSECSEILHLLIPQTRALSALQCLVFPHYDTQQMQSKTSNRNH